MSASGTTKLSISHGVLYGINEYAAIKPNDHNALNSANEFFGLKTAIAAPSTPRNSSVVSRLNNHTTYMDGGCTCAVRPVFVQTANVCSESVMPLVLVKNDE